MKRMSTKSMVLLAAGLVGAYFIYKQADNGDSIHSGNPMFNTLPEQSNLNPQHNKLLNKL
jgi:hypothetical protein